MKHFCLALLMTLLGPLLLLSCKPPDIPGIKDYGVSVANEHLSAQLVATTLHLNTGVTMPIPDLPGASFGVNPYIPPDPSEGGGTVFRIDVDLTQLKGKNYAMAGLPDGRPLPDVATGALPRWNFTIEGVTVDLYLADGAFALFIPLALSVDGYTLPSLISEEFDDERGNLVGKFYAIPVRDPGTVSGILLLVAPGLHNSCLRATRIYESDGI